MTRYFNLLLLFFVFSITTVYSQEKHAINGLVTNAKNTPIAFANIALYSAADSSMVQGVMTDDQGKFLFTEIMNGNYYLKAMFMGFQTFDLDDIVVSNSDVQLSPIILKRKATRLDEITVVSEKGMFESEAGKTVYNVEGNVNAVGESASELLQNIPSVGVDMDEKVTLRGSKATILIDGVESGLSTMLDQIPANAIESIEVISNPSVKYEAKNGGSIINIVLKKQARKGYNGKFEAGIGTHNQKNINAVLGYNFSNWRFTAMSNYKYSEREVDQLSVRTIADSDVDNELHQNSNDIRKPSSLFSSISAAYYFKDKSFVDLKYINQNKSQKNLTKTHSENFRNGEITSISDINRESLNSNTFNQFASKFRKLFSNGGKLDGGILYSFNDPQNEYDQLYQPFYLDNGLPRESYRIDNKAYLNTVRQLKSNLDYSGKISPKLKLEAGLLYAHDYNEQDFTNIKLNYNWNSYLEEYAIVADTLDKYFIKNTRSASAYSLISTSFNKYSLSAGLRLEYMKNVIESDSTTTNTVLKTVPSLHLRKTVSAKHFWELSVTARTKPPTYNQLNPISLSYGSYTKSSGNPDLKPEFFYQIEFGNSWKWDKTSFNLTLFYKNENDIIGRWYFIEEEDDKQVTHSIYENLGRIYSSGIDISSTIAIKKLVLRPSIVSYFTGIEGDKFSDLLDKEEFSYIVKLNSNYPINKLFSAQFSGSYNSPKISEYGKQFSYYQLDAGIKAKVLKNKGAVILKAVDILNSVEYDKIVNQRINYLKETHYDPKNFLVYLSFSYKFNSLKKKPIKPKINHSKA